MTLFEELGVEYKEVDGILYPLLSVDEAEYNLTDIGKYGRMWLRYMIENKPSEYRHMARMGQLRKQAEHRLREKIIVCCLCLHPYVW